MKHCTNCGKELPDEAQFCPYCMTRLTETVNVKKNHKHKKNAGSGKKAVVAVVVILCAAVIAAGIFAFVKYGVPAIRGGSGNSQSAVSNGSGIDYESYTGVYFDSDNSASSSIMETGGIELRLLSYDDFDDSFELSLTLISAPPSNRVAEISHIKAVADEDKARFTFEDDGWGNAGQGTITFQGNHVYLETVVTAGDPNAMWQLDITNQELIKMSVDNQYLRDLTELLPDIHTAAYYLGGEVMPNQDIESYVLHTFADAEIYTYYGSDEIYRITLEYDTLEKKQKYKFGELNGFTKFSDIEDITWGSTYMDGDLIVYTYEKMNGYHTELRFKNSELYSVSFWNYDYE